MFPKNLLHSTRRALYRFKPPGRSLAKSLKQDGGSLEGTVGGRKMAPASGCHTMSRADPTMSLTLEILASNCESANGPSRFLIGSIRKARPGRASRAAEGWRPRSCRPY